MVNVYKVSEDADASMQRKIAQLLMGQMDSLGLNDATNNLISTIQLALTPGSNAHIFVAEIDEQIVGAAFFNVLIGIDKGGQYIWLNELYVHKSYRQRGIAKKLLLHIIHWAEQHNIKGIELETGRNNEATKALYNSLGFHSIVSKRYGARF